MNAITVINNEAPAVQTSPEPLLPELQEAVTRPPQVPTAGQEAAESMFNLFEDAAQRIEILAQEGVKRALDLEATAKMAAANLRKIGDSLQTQISIESARARQIGLMMEEANNAIAAHGLPAAPDGK